MADSKITALTAETTPADADLIVVVDAVSGITKKMTYANLIQYLLKLVGGTMSGNILFATNTGVDGSGATELRVGNTNASTVKVGRAGNTAVNIIGTSTTVLCNTFNVLPLVAPIVGQALLATDTAGALAYSSVPRWVKVTKTYTDFSTGGTTNDIEIFSLPAKAIVVNAVMKHSAAFTGGAISAYTISIGVTPGSLTEYMAAKNVFQAPGDTIWFDFDSLRADPMSMVATVSVRAKATSTTANLDAATAGSVDIWLLVTTMP